MKVNIELTETIASEIASLAEKKNISIESMTVQLITTAVRRRNKNKRSPTVKAGTTPEASNFAMEVLLKRVRNLKPKEEFTVKELIIDRWGEIHNLISFGHKASKALRASGLVIDVPSTAASRRYRRI